MIQIYLGKYQSGKTQGSLGHFRLVLNIVIVIQIDNTFVHISQAYWSSSGMYQTQKV